MKERDSKQWDLFFFYLSLIIYPFNVLLSAVLRTTGFDFFASKTIFVCYGIVYLVFFFILFRYPISLKRLSSMFFIYLVYYIFYLTSPTEMKYRYLDVDMVMIYLFYLPYSVLILSRIQDISQLFTNSIVEYFNGFLIIASFLVKFILKDQTGYMVYSYNLLPIWILFSFRMIQKPNLVRLAIFGILVLEGVIYGARGPLIWLFISLIAYAILHRIENQVQIRLSIRSIQSGLMIFLGTVGFFFVLYQILSSLNIAQSYILNRIETGVLVQSTGRDSMIDIAVQYIFEEMGLKINGVFFDRTLMPGNVYVHNLFLEILLSFGWLFGILLLILLMYFIIITFKGSSISNKKVVVFLSSTFFLKYLLTGSVFEDYTFIIYLALMFSVYKQNKPDKLIVYEMKR